MSKRVSLICALLAAASMGFLTSGLMPTLASTSSQRGVTAGVLSWRHTAPATITVGHSTTGRAIIARRQGSPDAMSVILVLGQMHGNEPRGLDVVREVRRLGFPRGVQVWTISTMNPDGSAAHTRVNARNVDLNRNFPHLWKATTSSTYFPGKHPASEPETTAMIAFLNQLRPDVIISFHQAFRSVDLGPAKARRWVDILSAATGLPIKHVPCNGLCRGTMTGWFNSTFVGSAITVELPHQVTLRQAQIYARAVRSLSMASATETPTPSPSPTPSPTSSPSPTGSASPSGSPTPSVTSVPSSATPTAS